MGDVIELDHLDRAIKKLKTAIVVLCAVTLFAAGGFVYNLFDVSNINQRVTKVELAPCNAHPTGDQCQDQRRESSEVQSVSDACIPFRKVLLPSALITQTRCTITE